MNIYVLPTEVGKPPRALLFEPLGVLAEDEGVQVSAATGTLAMWSRDSGTWMVEGAPVPGDLAEAITEHAKNLGVEW